MTDNYRERLKRLLPAGYVQLFGVTHESDDGGEAMKRKPRKPKKQKRKGPIRVTKGPLPPTSMHVAFQEALRPRNV